MKKYLMILPAFVLVLGTAHAEPTGKAMFLHDHEPELEDRNGPLDAFGLNDWVHPIYTVPPKNKGTQDTHPNKSDQPFVAVVQNGDQSSMHVLEVPSLKACNTLARVVLYSKIQDQKRINKEIKKGEHSVWSWSYNVASPTEVWCIGADGYAFSLTPEILAEKDGP